MPDVKTAEQLAQRALDVNVVDEGQLQSVWSELGTRNVGLSTFQQALVRRGLLTSYQLERLMKGLRTGFFYGEYKVQYCVGSGTFARVFRAAHSKTGQLYAVKVLRARFSDKPKDAELFRREGELGSTLHHPNIVPIHEVYSRLATHFIVMDFIEGRNLREFYKSRRQFAPLEAAQISADIMAGLNYASQQGITHRDLKMSNVLLSSSGKAMLVDFGLAGLGDDDVHDAANPRTIDYAGLERATNVRKDDNRSDIYFAGCIFYQMLCGAPPLAETRDRAKRLSKTRYQDIRPILEVNSGLPPSLAMVVNRATEFDPDKRYQSASDMLMDLKLAIKRIKTASDGAEDNQRQLESREGLDENGQPRRLMVVESDGKMQDLFRKLFKNNGYRVLVSADPHRALSRFFDDHSTADMMLFSTASIGESALDVFNRFGQETLTRDLPAVLLLGQQHHEWERQADTAEHRTVVKMPVKPRQLREALVEAASHRVG